MNALLALAVALSMMGEPAVPAPSDPPANEPATSNETMAAPSTWRTAPEPGVI